MIVMPSVTRILMSAALFEAIFSLLIIVTAPVSGVLAASVNILSFLNVMVMGYRLKRTTIVEYWKIFIYGIFLLVWGGGVSIIAHLIVGKFDSILVIGVVISLLFFAPFYGILSIVGAYFQGLKNRK